MRGSFYPKCCKSQRKNYGSQCLPKMTKLMIFGQTILVCLLIVFPASVLKITSGRWGILVLVDLALRFSMTMVRTSGVVLLEHQKKMVTVTLKSGIWYSCSITAKRMAHCCHCQNHR